MNFIRIALISLICLILAGCEGVFAPSAPTSTPTITPYPFVTATPRPTDTPTLPPSLTPTPTRTPRPPTNTPTLSLPETGGEDETETPTATEQGVCVAPPSSVFGEVYASDPGLPPAIGCTIAPPDSEALPQIWTTQITFQAFERGYMIRTSNVGWVETPVIYALFDDGSYSRFDDHFDPNDPATPIRTPEPPDGRLVPSGALYKVWREVAGLRERLGFAVSEPFVEILGQMQIFEYGEMVFVAPFNEVYAFRRAINLNTWSSYQLSP